LDQQKVQDNRYSLADASKVQEIESSVLLPRAWPVDDFMNLSEAINLGKSQLLRSSSPYLDARLLLEDVTKYNHSQIIAHPELELDTDHEHLYLQRIQRAAAGEPIPYITGQAYFAGLKLKVDPAVLIPRPETEMLVNAAVDWANSASIHQETLNIVDVGTGSGCIAIALAVKLKGALIAAIDSSKSALKIARKNAELNDVSNQITFLAGNLLDSIQFVPDLIVANLPYIADHEWSLLDDGVKWFEPTSALRGGIDGLEMIGRLLKQAKLNLAPGGAIFLEIGWQQGLKSRRIAEEVFPLATVEVSADFAGHDRLLSIVNAY
jgi:release factor glutamine methyltransferase